MTMNNKRKLSIVVYLCVWTISLFAPQRLCAQQAPDTVRAYSIPEVTISEHYRTREVRATSPVQTFTKAQLNSLNVLQVSDAVKHFAGVTVKDYGGIGGLKTVSLRSLGAEHTAVSYDGITISDTQTGQVDIGRFSLDNVDRLSLSNGQSDNIFQPARLFASAGVLNIQTLAPQFTDGKDYRISGAIKTGSWGLINPAVLIERKLNETWALSAHTEWMSVDGRYPYTMHYGEKNDSTSREKRHNTEVNTLRTEVGLFGRFSDTEQWRIKAYYYQASRGLPGATTLYYDYASQHLWDKNTFVQSQYKKEFSRKWVFQTSAKWSWNYQRYLDPDHKGSTGKTENKYYQQEYYLSASLLYRLMHNLSLSLANDGSIHTLGANQSQFADPTRYTWLSAMAGKYVNDHLTASASLLATVVNEKAHYGASADNHRKLTPYVSVSVKPFAGEELRIRAFYKKIFRLPTFNDLYYTEVGSTELSPEKTSQYNIGITYGKTISRFVPYASATIDAYYNKVNDKIIAIPTKNIFIWSMVNLGEVEIKGIDATATVTLEPIEDIRLNLSGNYTYQRALDVTDPEGKTYDQQIAYTPRVSGSGQATLEMPWVNLSYSFVHSGKRYALGQNLEENRLGSYTDHSLAANRDFRIKQLHTNLRVEVLNVLDKNYEIVRNFPMPGRSIRATIKVNY